MPRDAPLRLRRERPRAAAGAARAAPGGGGWCGAWGPAQPRVGRPVKTKRIDNTIITINSNHSDAHLRALLIH